jgi:hypothetical protein
VRIVELIKSWFTGGPKAPQHAEETFDVEGFIYVKIPGNIQPLERGELFEDEIERALAEDDLGSVSGGGSSLSHPRPDGSRIVEFCGIDIDAKDRDRTLAKLREILMRLHAPHGTELHYTRTGSKLQDVLANGVWQLGLTRQFLHPGFGL